MEKIRLFSISAFVLLLFSISSAFAMSPFGPPKAGLTQGQYDLGVDYSYSQFCMEFGNGKYYSGGGNGSMPSFTKNKMKMDTVTGRLGYGFSDCWEGFFRLGGARMRNSEDGERFDSDGCAYGLGTKVTFVQDDRIDWGALFQVDWTTVDGDWDGPGWTGSADVDIMQMVVAVGPTYKLDDKTSIYGGPFWYCLDGEKKYYEKSPDPTWKEEYDLDECSSCGAFIGTEIKFGSNSVMNIEYQLTDDDDTIGISLRWLF